MEIIITPEVYPFMKMSKFGCYFNYIITLFNSVIHDEKFDLGDTLIFNKCILYTDEIIYSYQCDFRKGKSTTHHVFAIR
jgi:hypothetical protein